MSAVLLNDFAGARSLQSAIGPLFTCTRASVASFINAAGQIEEAAVDEARFDYDGQGNCLGLLSEKASTNIEPNSEDMTTGYVYNRGSMAANQGTAPDGANTANRFTENTATGSHGVYDTFALNNGSYYMSSVFVKADERESVSLTHGGAGFAGNVTITVDLTDGSITNVGAGTIDSYGAIALADDWYWIYICSVADSNATGYPLLSMQDSGGNTSYTGDGSSGMFFWGLNFCEQRTFGSYIRTSGGTATRAIDVITTADMTWFNNTQGSVICGFRQNRAYVETTSSILAIAGGSASSRWCVYTGRATATMQFVADGGSTIVTSGPNLLADMGDLKYVASRIEQSDIKNFHAGAQIGADTSTTDPFPTPISMYVGSNRSGATQMDGHVAYLMVDDEAVDDSVLTDWSNGVSLPAIAGGGHAPGIGLSLGRMGMR